jgi:putative NADPH-quinone reductase
MPRRIVIIQGHPDNKAPHLLHALADAYEAGATRGGFDVSRIDVASLDFQLLRTQQEFESGEIAPGLRAAAEALGQADHIAIFFPLWLGTMPALLKGFLEQTFKPGVAFAYGEGFPKQLFKGKSARVVVTMGMPAFAYRWFYLAHGLRGLERSILKFVGVAPVRDTMLGNVGAASEATKKNWLAKMRRLGQAGN